MRRCEGTLKSENGHSENVAVTTRWHRIWLTHRQEFSGERFASDDLDYSERVDVGRIVHLMNDLQLPLQLLERLTVDHQFAIHITDWFLDIHHPPVETMLPHLLKYSVSAKYFHLSNIVPREHELNVRMRNNAAIAYHFATNPKVLVTCLNMSIMAIHLQVLYFWQSNYEVLCWVI